MVANQCIEFWKFNAKSHYDLSIVHFLEAWCWVFLKFIYSEKATKICEISTLLLSHVVSVKNKVEISQNIVAFSEYMNFNTDWFVRILFSDFNQTFHIYFNLGKLVDENSIVSWSLGSMVYQWMYSTIYFTRKPNKM